MASVVNEPNGGKRISFRGVDGLRRSLRLGTASVDEARTVAVHVQTILDAASAGIILDGCDASDLAKLPANQPGDALATVGWIADLDGELRAKLAAVGLVHASESSVAPCAALSTFTEQYVSGRVDAKASSRIVYGRARNLLLEHFGPDRELQAITAGDACDWRLWLIGKGLADTTVRKMCSIARMVFKAALKRELIESNPPSPSMWSAAGWATPSRSRDATTCTARMNTSTGLSRSGPRGSWRPKATRDPTRANRCKAAHRSALETKKPLKIRGLSKAGRKAKPG